MHLESQADSTIPASEFIRIEAAALPDLALRLDTSMQAPFAAAVASLLAASGSRSVLLTGIGKSGLIAQKIAATLRSTGTSAHFLHPAEAVHGDLGMVAPHDT